MVETPAPIFMPLDTLDRLQDEDKFCRIVVDTFGELCGLARLTPEFEPDLMHDAWEAFNWDTQRLVTNMSSKGMKIGAGVSTIVSPDFHQRRKVRQHLPASDFSGVSARRCWGSCTSAFRRRAQEIPNRNPPAENASAGHLFVVSLEIFPRVFHLGLGNSREIIGATQNRYLLYWIC